MVLIISEWFLAFSMKISGEKIKNKLFFCINISKSLKKTHDLDPNFGSFYFIFKVEMKMKFSLGTVPK